MSGLDSDKLKWTANGRNMKWNREAAEKIEDEIKAVADAIKELEDYGSAAVVDLSDIFANKTLLYNVQQLITKVLTAGDGKKYTSVVTTSMVVEGEEFSIIESCIDNNKPLIIMGTFTPLDYKFYCNDYVISDNWKSFEFSVPKFNFSGYNFSLDWDFNFATNEDYYTLTVSLTAQQIFDSSLLES